jgi:hypothetical protein
MFEKYFLKLMAVWLLGGAMLSDMLGFSYTHILLAPVMVILALCLFVLWRFIIG